jgi:hypothetical protein
MRPCTQLKGLRSGTVIGWLSPAGRAQTGRALAVQTSPEELRTMKRRPTHLGRLGTCLASQPAVKILRSLLAGDQTQDELTAALASDDVEVKRLLNELHAANLPPCLHLVRQVEIRNQ